MVLMNSSRHSPKPITLECSLNPKLLNPKVDSLNPTGYPAYNTKLLNPAAKSPVLPGTISSSGEGERPEGIAKSLGVGSCLGFRVTRV